MPSGKPAPWAVTAGFIAPEFRNIYRQGVCICPFWPGVPFDIIGWRKATLPANTTEEATKTGIARRFSTVNEYAQFPEDRGIVNAITYVLAFKVTGANFVTSGSTILGQTDIGASGGARGSDALVDWSLLYTGTILRARFIIAGSNTNLDITVTIAVGDQVVVALRRSGANAKLFCLVNGVLSTASSSSIPSGDLDRDFTTELHVGSGRTGASTTSDTDLAAEIFYLSDQRLLDVEVMRMLFNPFGIIRMIDEVGVVVGLPVVAGGPPAGSLALMGVGI